MLVFLFPPFFPTRRHHRRCPDDDGGVAGGRFFTRPTDYCFLPPRATVSLSFAFLVRSFVGETRRKRFRNVLRFFSIVSVVSAVKGSFLSHVTQIYFWFQERWFVSAARSRETRNWLRLVRCCCHKLPLGQRAPSGGFDRTTFLLNLQFISWSDFSSFFFFHFSWTNFKLFYFLAVFCSCLNLIVNPVGARIGGHTSSWSYLCLYHDLYFLSLSLSLSLYQRLCANEKPGERGVCWQWQWMFQNQLDQIVWWINVLCQSGIKLLWTSELNLFSSRQMCFLRFRLLSESGTVSWLSATFFRPEVISQKNEEVANPGKEKKWRLHYFFGERKKTFVGNYDRRLESQEMLVRGSIAAQNYGSTSSVEWQDVFQEDPCLFKHL